MKKKLLSLALALFMVLTFIPASVMAEENSTVTIDDLGDSYKVGDVVEFKVTTNPTEADKEKNVLGWIEGLKDSEVAYVEYKENGVYKPLTSDYFGPINEGFPFVNTSSEFKITFLKEGSVNVKISINEYVKEESNKGNELASVSKEVTVKGYIDSIQAVNTTTNKTYDSLQEAINEAVNGQTITLVKDIVTSQAITLKDGVTLDGNNHKITAEGKINAIEAHGKSTVKNLTVDTGKDGKYAVQAYMTDGAVIENVKVIDNSEGYAGLLVNGGTATLRNVSYEGSSYSVVELAKGENVVNNPVVTIDGSITSTNNVPAFYVDAKQISNPDVNSLIVVNDTASGLIVPGSSLEFDKNGVLIVTKPAVKPEAPVCAGSKDKNCDGVVTCDEEKGEGWTWNNKLKVCEYTGKTSYTVVNTAAK